MRFNLADLWETRTVVPRTTGVYAIRCLINGNLYVGSAAARAWGLRGRLHMHVRALKNGNHHSYRLQRSVLKYGAVNFEWQLLESVEPAHCEEREQFYIDLLKPAYNSARRTTPHPNTRGKIIRTPEYCAKISQALKGRKPSALCIQRSVEARRERGVSAETRQKMSAARKGLKEPPEWAAKRWITRAQNGTRGHTAATRKRLAEAGARPFTLMFKGEVFSGTNMLIFAKENGLDYSHLQALKRGARKSHKGWTIPA